MSWRVSLRSDAATDLREARSWYENARAGLGDEFLLATIEAFSRLEETPERFPLYYKGFRRLLVDRFPYRILYRIDGDEVVVFRILHAARDHKAPLP